MYSRITGSTTALRAASHTQNLCFLVPAHVVRARQAARYSTAAIGLCSGIAAHPWHVPYGMKACHQSILPAPRVCFFSAPVEDPDRLERVLARIDDANRQCPQTVDVESVKFPYELAYSVWVSFWVKHLDPSPSEALVIAARGQHICRWEVPRNSYPEGRQGYLKWREDLKRMHSDKVGAIMQDEGYSEEEILRVKQIMLKKDLKDRDTQTLEDALCLVFFEHQFEGVQKALPADKLRDVVRKTWKKMGIRGQAAAAQMPLPAELLPELQVAQS